MTRDSPLVQVLISREQDDRVGHDLLSVIDGLELLEYDPNEPLPASHQGAEILIPPYRSSHRPRGFVSKLPHLRMVQLLSAGADEWAGDVPASVTLATARGAQAGPVSEWALSAILCLYRQWPALVGYQQEHTWAHRKVDADTLNGKRALIVGAGHIGRAIAAKLEAFGASVTLVAHTAREGVHGADETRDLVPDHQLVVIVAPLTGLTRDLVDAKFLAAMPDDALLVNAARGAIVDTGALVAELQAGRLRAALDVTEPEPLPEDHALWSCPGVIVSPHMARTVPGTNQLCYEVATEQIAAFLRGGTPSNIVHERPG